MFGIQNLEMISKDVLKEIYDAPSMLIEIEFSNSSKVNKQIFIEPSCYELTINAETEYKVVTHDKTFRLEFDTDGEIIFYLQYSFGFKLYKRAKSQEIKNPFEWEIDFDCSDIN